MSIKIFDELEKQFDKEVNLFKSPSDCSECKEISSLKTQSTDSSPGASPNYETKYSKFQFPEISLSPNRFKSSIPAQFLCPSCKNVVFKPQACISCETLFCYSCLPVTCLNTCDKNKFKEPSERCLNKYDSLRLTCKNNLIGCPFEDTICKTLEHEEACVFVLDQCENVLCEDFIVRKSDENTDTKFLCSEVCENLIKFSVMINEDSLFETLEAFKGLMERCKKLAENQVKDDMKETIRKIEEMRRGKEALVRAKDRIQKEIELRKISFHSGLWNVRSLRWTCCKNTEIDSVGCKQID